MAQGPTRKASRSTIWLRDYVDFAQVSQSTLKSPGRAPTTADKFLMWDDVAAAYVWVDAREIVAQHTSDFDPSSGESCYSLNTTAVTTKDDARYLLDLQVQSLRCVSVSTAGHLRAEDTYKLAVGSGLDLFMRHDGTECDVWSTIAGRDDEAALRVGWDIETDRTSLTATAPNRPYLYSQSCLDVGHTESGGTWASSFRFFPYTRPAAGNPGPGLWTINHNRASQGWSIGMTDTANDYYCMMVQSGTTELTFFAADVQAFSAGQTGLRLGGTTNSQIRTYSPSGAVTGRLIIEPGGGLEPTGDYVFVQTQGSVATKTAGRSPFTVYDKGNNVYLFRVFHADETYPGIGVQGDDYVLLDNNGTAQGTTHLRYASANSRVELTVDGTLAAAWPGRIVAVDRYTSNQTLTAANHTVFGDTDGGSFTVSLPAGVAGTEYRIVNTGTSGNNLTIAPNGSELLIGANSNFTLSDGEALIVAYDATEGWY